MLTAIGRTTILVHDYDEALEFYRDVLGFHPLHDTTAPDGQRYLHMGIPGQAGDPPVGLWFLQPGNGDSDLIGCQAGGQPLLVLYTDDCRATAATLAERGVRFPRLPAERDGAVFAHFLDLYGNEFVLVELPQSPNTAH
ncbi:MAG TPA: VOC family protein [Gemmatimonadaceae bacterium]